MNQNSGILSKTKQTRALCINAMFVALTFLATMCVNIRLPIMATVLKKSMPEALLGGK